uniref:CUB domain-containing protein n=1 Tax=Cacopsylla melanoneura TaxID=428564 RepID=A0A8D8UFI7_9HEMI
MSFSLSSSCHVLISTTLILLVVLSTGCRISEYGCRNHRCVRLDQYCNGRDDCGDKSDEPKHCTVCNRTFYGEVDNTYQIQLNKPREQKLPFLCHLTFTANGHVFGDIVQLMFDKFALGRFEASFSDACPYGYMQISELGRPYTGGSWCGAASSYAVYFTETSTVTVTVRLHHFGVHNQTPFEFSLRYKFIRNEEASARFGTASALIERGEVVPGSYCSRNFYDCYRNKCKIQSPNYPGMYPRNVTCFYSIRQKVVPKCKHAMISIKQINNFKLQIKRSLLDHTHQGLTPNMLDFSPDSSPHREEARQISVDSTSLDDFYLESSNHAQSEMNFNVQIETDTLSTEFRNRSRSLIEVGSQLGNDASQTENSLFNKSNKPKLNAANENQTVFNNHKIVKRSNTELKYTCDEPGDGVDRRDARLGIWSSSNNEYTDENNLENTIERIATADNEPGANIGESRSKNRRSLLENRNILSLKSSSTHILKQKPQSQGKDKTKITDLNTKSGPTQKGVIVNIKEDDLKKNWTSGEDMNTTDNITMIEITTLLVVSSTTTSETPSTTHDPKVKLIDLKQKVKELTKQQKKVKADKLDKNSGEKKGKDKKGKQGKEKSTERNETTTKKKPKNKDGNKSKDKTDKSGGKKQPKEPKPKKQPKEGAKKKENGKNKDTSKNKFKDKDKIKFIERHEERLIESKKNMTTNKDMKLKSWDECTSDGDYLIFYDGPTQADPVLFKYCGNGFEDYLPSIVSRAPQMLVEFHSSSYSTPKHSLNTHLPLRGFELDVDVVFSDSDSFDFSRYSRKCEFWINATNSNFLEVLKKPKGRMGHLLSARHTIPPNTTCTYRFIGKPYDRVWISFLTYNHYSIEGPSAKCSTRLRIWDTGGNSLGDHCETPKLCDHSSLSNITRMTRPCKPEESYISTSSSIVIQHILKQGTVIHPASFSLKYEFIDTRLGGDPLAIAKMSDYYPEPQTSCSRIYRNIQTGDIESPKNTFLFGRGGAQNLSCLYRIESDKVRENIHLTLHNISFGRGSMQNNCVTEVDPNTNRYLCIYKSPAAHPTPPHTKLTELKIFEIIHGLKLLKHCICDNVTVEQPFMFTSSTNIVEVQFTVTNLHMSDDYLSVYFTAQYNLSSLQVCTQKQHSSAYNGGGEIMYNSDTTNYCNSLPWILQANYNKSLFLMTWGYYIPHNTLLCNSKNRLLVYSAHPVRLRRIICPSRSHDKNAILHIFSDDWFSDSTKQNAPSLEDFEKEQQININNNLINHYLNEQQKQILYSSKPPMFILEYISKDSTDHQTQINWLEISKPKLAHYTDAAKAGNVTLLPDCKYKCPEINACIEYKLWCDGVSNCPSGHDEELMFCGINYNYFSVLPTYLILLVICVFAILFLIFIFNSRSSKNSYDMKRNNTREDLLSFNSSQNSLS